MNVFCLENKSEQCRLEYFELRTNGKYTMGKEDNQVFLLNMANVASGTGTIYPCGTSGFTPV